MARQAEKPAHNAQNHPRWQGFFPGRTAPGSGAPDSAQNKTGGRRPDPTTVKKAQQPPVYSHQFNAMLDQSR
jgi:hypothetical protein